MPVPNDRQPAMPFAAGTLAERDAHAMRDMLTRADAVLATHLNWKGMCDGCVQIWARLAPLPCEQRRWAMAVIERYDKPSCGSTASSAEATAISGRPV
jgi:hypothetical protein